MNYGAWIKNNLTQTTIAHNDGVVSFWATRPSKKPVLLLVHGISGDHVGLVPFAAELARDYRVVLVDLPGHGGSTPVPLPNAQVLQRWFSTVLGEIEREVGEAAAICAHSFGCSAVIGNRLLEKRRVILLNPVPAPSGMYASYSRMIMDSAHLWAHVYNWRPFVMLRGMTLAKIRTRETLKRVRWVGRYSRPSFEQIVFQASLVDMILDGLAYENVQDGRVALVVCGMYDTTARQRDTLDMEQVFGSTPIVFLKGGHLLPIESPERVAHLVREAMV